MLEKTASRMRSVAGRTCFARPVEMGMPLATPPVMRMNYLDDRYCLMAARRYWV